MKSGAQTDADVATANEGRGERLTVLSLLEEMRERSKLFEVKAFPNAVLCERYLDGQQFHEVRDGRLEDVVEGRGWPSGVPLISRNLLRNLALTWGARLTKDGPSVKAWAHEATENDDAAATVANDLIEYYSNEHKERTLLARAAWLAQAHTAIASYVVWDPARGPLAPRFVDGSGGEPLGDVHEELLPIFEWGTDGAEDIADSQWCFVRKYIDEWAARARLTAAGIDAEPTVDEYPTVWGTGARGVEVFEIWHRKNDRIPDGLFALVVSGHVVDHRAFPYDHGELPLSVWKIGSKSRSPYGSSHVNDAVPLQANLNKLHGVLSLITSRSARWMKVLGPKTVVQNWDGDMQAIELNDAELLKAVRILTPPPPPPLLLQQIEEHERMINLVFGVNEAVAGSDVSSTKNAKMLAYISELDAQKLSEARRNLEAWRLRVVRQKLRLVQQYVDAERVVRVVTPDGKAKAVAFQGANLAGIDVILEAAPQMGRAAQANEAERAAAAGFLDPVRAREMRQTGLPETRYEAIARSAARGLVEQALSGQPVQPDPGIPPEVALAELSAAIEQQPDNLALFQLMQAYEQMRVQPGGAQQAPQAGASSPEGAQALGALTQ